MPKPGSEGHGKSGHLSDRLRRKAPLRYFTFRSLDMRVMRSVSRLQRQNSPLLSINQDSLCANGSIITHWAPLLIIHVHISIYLSAYLSTNKEVVLRALVKVFIITSNGDHVTLFHCYEASNSYSHYQLHSRRSSSAS